jgi:hypothetical protein
LNRPAGRLKRRLKDNIKIDLKETGWEVVDWSLLARDRVQWRNLVNVVTGKGEIIL